MPSMAMAMDGQMSAKAALPKERIPFLTDIPATGLVATRYSNINAKASL